MMMTTTMMVVVVIKMMMMPSLSCTPPLARNAVHMVERFEISEKLSKAAPQSTSDLSHAALSAEGDLHEEGLNKRRVYEGPLLHARSLWVAHAGLPSAHDASQRREPISRKRLGSGRRAFRERCSSFPLPSAAVPRAAVAAAALWGEETRRPRPKPETRGKGARARCCCAVPAAADDDKGARRRLGGRPHKRPPALRKTPVGLSSPSATQPAPLRELTAARSSARAYTETEKTARHPSRRSRPELLARGVDERRSLHQDEARCGRRSKPPVAVSSSLSR